MIQILLATYHGERHLPELLASLDAQTDQDFTVLARDDGSTDGTVALLRAWGAQRPGRLSLLDDGGPSGSASANFGRLLQASTAPHVMCCDQDDVWLPGKVATTRAAMRELERAAGPGVPALVHTDLAVVGADLTPIAGSFWRYQHLAPATARRFHRLLMQNVVTGCTMLVNRALLDRALPVPAAAIMHDWWLALVANAFGRIAEVPAPTILYRQHGANQLGAQAFTAGHVARKAVSLFARAGLARSIHRGAAQAAAFLDRYAGQLTPPQRRAATALASLPTAGFLARRWRILRHRLFKIGVARNLGLLLRV
jgi:glycosyltransferase involved in cell wall biosynthesis